ncbi:MAG: hypothetical protein A2X46_01480 [Lentisphaerae bacterium GWF2_57_35]|nr:MAG: hypothetical protein A2X46_01480 [Lentisphaerae bacterium GWF2_57_35]
MFVLLTGLTLQFSWAGLNDGLVLNYSFSGNFNDSSGQGNNAQSHGSVVFTSDNDNRANSAAYFAGYGSYLDAGSAASINLVGPMSISAWINPDDIGGYGSRCRTIAGKWYDLGNSPLRQYALGYVLGGHPFFDTGAGGSFNELIVTNVTLQTGRWTHMTGVYNGTNLIVYVDGLECGRATTVMSTVSQAVNLTMGAAVAGDYGAASYQGKMDELRIYNRALSAQEISSLYVQGGGEPPAPPAAPIEYNSVIGFSNQAEGNQAVNTYRTNEKLYIRIKDKSLDSRNSKCWAAAQLQGKKVVGNRLKNNVVTIKLTPQADGSFLGVMALDSFYPGNVIVTVGGFYNKICALQRASLILIVR